MGQRPKNARESAGRTCKSVSDRTPQCLTHHSQSSPSPHLREAKGVKLSAEGEQGPGGRGGAPAQKGLKRGLLVRLGERIQHNGDGQ